MCYGVLVRLDGTVGLPTAAMLLFAHWRNAGTLEVCAHVCVHFGRAVEHKRATRMLALETTAARNDTTVVGDAHVLLQVVAIDEKALAMIALFGASEQVRLLVVRYEARARFAGV